MLLKNSRFILSYSTIIGNKKIINCQMKDGPWIFNNGYNHIFAHNRELNIKYGGNYVSSTIKPIRFVKKLNMRVIHNNKIITKLNIPHNDFSEYSLLLNYCDKDMVTYLKVERINNREFKRVDEDDIVYSF